MDEYILGLLLHPWLIENHMRLPWDFVAANRTQTHNLPTAQVLYSLPPSVLGRSHKVDAQAVVLMCVAAVCYVQQRVNQF